MNTETQHRFVTYPIASFRHYPIHPEVPEHQQNPVWQLVVKLRRQRHNAVLTDQGEVLGFITYFQPLVPETHPPVEAGLNKRIFTARLLRQWSNYDCVGLNYRNRRVGWFVPVKHQDLLPIPHAPLSL